MHLKKGASISMVSIVEAKRRKSSKQMHNQEEDQSMFWTYNIFWVVSIGESGEFSETYL